VTERGCADVAVRLSAWIDRELDAPAAAEVREHLAACAPCRRRHALLAAAGRAVRSLPEETVSAGFEDAFRRRLAAARAGDGGPSGRSPVLLAAAGLAAVLVLALLGALALRRASVPAAAPATSAREVPLWLASCGAPTAGECRLETPCASALACGGFPLPAARAGGWAGAPCASASTCGAVFVVSTASAGRFSETSPPAFRRPR
jgi:hypothetical protein